MFQLFVDFVIVSAVSGGSNINFVHVFSGMERGISILRLSINDAIASLVWFADLVNLS